MDSVLQKIRSRFTGPVRRAAITTLEVTLWGVGALGIGAALYTWIDAASFQRRSSARLSQGVAAATPASLRRDAPAPGEPFAEIEIEKLDLSAVVAEGADETVLRRAVGHLPFSPLPGEPGNTVLAGHRDTHFRALADAEPGDLVVLREPAAEHRYRVEWVRVVEPSATEVLDDTSVDSLTLITCYPFRYIGPAPRRFVVRARKVSSTWTEESS